MTGHTPQKNGNGECSQVELLSTSWVESSQSVHSDMPFIAPYQENEISLLADPAAMLISGLWAVPLLAPTVFLVINYQTSLGNQSLITFHNSPLIPTWRLNLFSLSMVSIKDAFCRSKVKLKWTALTSIYPSNLETNFELQKTLKFILQLIFGYHDEMKCKRSELKSFVGESS